MSPANSTSSISLLQLLPLAAGAASKSNPCLLFSFLSPLHFHKLTSQKILLPKAQLAQRRFASSHVIIRKERPTDRPRPIFKMGKKGKKAQAGKPKKLSPKDIGKRLDALVKKLEKELEGADLFAPLPPAEDFVPFVVYHFRTCSTDLSTSLVVERRFVGGVTQSTRW